MVERSTKRWWARKAFDWWVAPNVPKTPGSIRQMASDVDETRKHIKGMCEEADPRTVPQRIVEKGEEGRATVTGIKTAHRLARWLFLDD